MVCPFVMLLIAVETLQLRVLLGQLIDPRAERMYTGIAGTVNEMNGTACFERNFKHWQGRSNAHATADQYQRLIALGQGELSSGWK